MAIIQQALLTKQAENLIKNTASNVAINWDVTEQTPRIGYYFAREYGNIFLQNCENNIPGTERLRHILYNPFLTLRQAWHLAHYMNLNQIQITIQDVDVIPPEFTSASQYSHAYCFAIAMMGIPLFFQETHFLSTQAREELRPIIALYKKHRENILSGYVYPIGKEPDNKSFTGFQCHLPYQNIGYLIIFREIEAKNNFTNISLNFLANKNVILTNLIKKTTEEIVLDNSGIIKFSIPKPGNFTFIKYQWN